MRQIIGRQAVSAVSLAVLLAACGGVAAPVTTASDSDVTTVSTEAVVAETTSST